MIKSKVIIKRSRWLVVASMGGWQYIILIIMSDCGSKLSPASSCFSLSFT